MLLAETDIDPNLISKLQNFNIRTIEQLLVLRRSNRRIWAFSKVIGTSQKEATSMLEDIASNYKDLEPAVSTSQHRQLGYRMNDLEI